MAFICPSKEDSERRRDVLCKLKNAVDKLVEEEGPVPVQMCPPPCVPCCPPYCPPCCPPCCVPYCPYPCSSPVESTKKETICKPPEVMVCYKVKKSTKDNVLETKGKTKKGGDKSKVKQSKSRELRAGILYIGCDCEKLNGLQDDCRRSECHGSPECLTKPKPTCGPSEFSNGKHLGRKNDKNGVGAGSDGNNRKIGERNDVLDEYECFPAVFDTSRFCTCTS